MINEDVREDQRLFHIGEDGSGFTCDIVFEHDVPYAVWGIRNNKECWVKLEKEFLQTVNSFIGGEFIHYLYQKPIKLYEKKS